MTKKQIALALAAVLAAVAGTLRQCPDETPVMPGAPVSADAGAP